MRFLRDNFVDSNNAQYDQNQLLEGRSECVDAIVAHVGLNTGGGL